MIYKLAYDNNGYFKGFYSDEIHDNIPEPNIKIDENLWQKLLSNQYRLIINKQLEDKIYRLIDLEIFEEYTNESSSEENPKSEIDLLKEELLNQSEMALDLDYRLTNIELGL